KEKIRTHHDAIEKILQYRDSVAGKPIWTAECDMKKFYDSVNHNIIKTQFLKFLKKAGNDHPEIDLAIPKRIFFAYLDCYSFNKIVLPLNANGTFWKSYGIVRGEFGWVEKELRKLDYYNRIPKPLRTILKWINCGPLNKKLSKYEFDIESKSIGIPQGGALSGLIANIVLDYTDRKTLSNSDIFYLRFCDDMILMHCNDAVCNDGIKRYQKSLRKMKLVPHPFSNKLKKERETVKRYLPPMTFSPFWNEKSKGPYKWSHPAKDGFPWIGFVGYEINFEGLVRVRRSSLEKEYRKQIEIINKLKKVIEIGKKVNNGSVCESAVHQLIGMSVGRLQIWNYEETDNDMCWKNGFKALTVNKHSIKQLKFLDRGRNKLYYSLIKELDTLYTDSLPPKEKKKRQIIDFNKPFSYYYHFVDKSKVGCVRPGSSPS
ncbi:reverse transcriptase domain-containing protein, partial [Flavobacterium sp.]|uniref:reverse transcriptase domain-containing protein n=1 Tax=Flavobacterium sp. TaxID=239 RepID=UPI00260353D5